MRRAVQGQHIPLTALTSDSNPLVITRINQRTIEIRTDKGSITEYDLTFIKKNIKFSMQPGQIVKMNDMSVAVLEVKDGLPSAARFRFSVPLEDESLIWFRWQDGEYTSFIPPAVGEVITLKGVSMFK